MNSPMSQDNCARRCRPGKVSLAWSRPKMCHRGGKAEEASGHREQRIRAGGEGGEGPRTPDKQAKGPAGVRWGKAGPGRGPGTRAPRSARRPWRSLARGCGASLGGVGGCGALCLLPAPGKEGPWFFLPGVCRP